MMLNFFYSSLLKPHSRAHTALVVLWIALIAVGMGWMVNFELTPGPAIASAETLPVPATQKPTLTIFVHPYCPCSRASLAELDHVFRQPHTSVELRIVVVPIPASAGEPAPDITHTAIWKASTDIPGASVLCDTDGALLARFKPKTSGHVFLHDAAGALRFSGGITASRGHEGTNAGLVALQELIVGSATPGPLITYPVFGCSLE